LLLLRPFAAEVRLCRPAVGALSPMQGTADPIIIKIGAGGDDLCFDREIPRPFHLAEIRWAPGTHQGLQPALPLGTHDLDLEVAAAGSPAGIVRGSARGQRTRVGRAENGEAVAGKRECPEGSPPALDNEKSILTQLARLLPANGPAWRGSREAVGGAAGGASVWLQETARDVQRGVDVELPLILPDIIEADVLSVTDEPSGLVIQRGVPLFERPHPKHHRYPPALRAERVTGRGHGTLEPAFAFDGGIHAHPGRSNQFCRKLTILTGPGTG